jgi:5-methylthioadenosine/S-adenosylhomocysteine deaminase
MMNSSLIGPITVVTPDENLRMKVIEAAWVAILGNRIMYAGPSEQSALQALPGLPGERIGGQQRIILPAMANAHGHIPMTLLRNQAGDYALHDWLCKFVFPREQRLRQQSVYWGSLLGMCEMIRNGTGAAAEMYYFHEASALAALESGFRLNFCCDIKMTGENNETKLMPGLLEDQIRQYQQHPSGLLRVSMLVHSIYLYKADLYPQMAEIAASLACDVQVHVSETRQEVEDCLAQYGCRPPRQLEQFGFFKTRTIAAHCVHLDDSDRQILARNPVLVAHNPSSNLKLGSGMADVPAMIRAGIRVGLGTDGAASNNNLDLYREMRLASFLAKGTSCDATRLPAAAVLNMATCQGMRGMGFADSGRIEAGCLADLQIVHYNRPSMTPLGDPVEALVYSADGNCVESLMVNGRWLMRGRELLTIDEERVLHTAAKEAERLNVPLA